MHRWYQHIFTFWSGLTIIQKRSQCTWLLPIWKQLKIKSCKKRLQLNQKIMVKVAFLSLNEQLLQSSSLYLFQIKLLNKKSRFWSLFLLLSLGEIQKKKNINLDMTFPSWMQLSIPLKEHLLINFKLEDARFLFCSSQESPDYVNKSSWHLLADT